MSSGKSGLEALTVTSLEHRTVAISRHARLQCKASRKESKHYTTWVPQGSGNHLHQHTTSPPAHARVVWLGCADTSWPVHCSTWTATIKGHVTIGHSTSTDQSTLLLSFFRLRI